MATRSHFLDGVIDTTGKALSNVRITVTAAANPPGSGGTSTIYVQRVGGSSKANPFTTDSTGLVEFFAEPGVYDVKIEDLNVPIRFATRYRVFDAISGAGITTAQIEDNAVTLAKHADDSVGMAELISDSVSSAEIAANAVGASEIGAGAVSVSEMGVLPVLRLKRTTNQSIPDTNATDIIWEAADINNDAMWSSGATATIVTAGIYLIVTSCAWVANNVGARRIRILKNGLALTGSRQLASSVSEQGAVALVHLNATDTIKVEVYQTSTGSLSLDVSVSAPDLALHWLSAA